MNNIFIIFFFIFLKLNSLKSASDNDDKLNAILNNLNNIKKTIDDIKKELFLAEIQEKKNNFNEKTEKKIYETLLLEEKLAKKNMEEDYKNIYSAEENAKYIFSSDLKNQENSTKERLEKRRKKKEENLANAKNSIINVIEEISNTNQSKKEEISEASTK